MGALESARRLAGVQPPPSPTPSFLSRLSPAGEPQGCHCRQMLDTRAITMQGPSEPRYHSQTPSAGQLAYRCYMPLPARLIAQFKQTLRFRRGRMAVAGSGPAYIPHRAPQYAEWGGRFQPVKGSQNAPAGAATCTGRPPVLAYRHPVLPSASTFPKYRQRERRGLHSGRSGSSPERRFTTGTGTELTNAYKR
eukprot:scaffold3258_cov382-Prasinococcus_capsulatus_cf.AAC.2